MVRGLEQRPGLHWHHKQRGNTQRNDDCDGWEGWIPRINRLKVRAWMNGWGRMAAQVAHGQRAVVDFRKKCQANISQACQPGLGILMGKKMTIRHCSRCASAGGVYESLTSE